LLSATTTIWAVLAPWLRDRQVSDTNMSSTPSVDSDDISPYVGGQCTDAECLDLIARVLRLLPPSTLALRLFHDALSTPADKISSLVLLVRLLSNRFSSETRRESWRCAIYETAAEEAKQVIALATSSKSWRVSTAASIVARRLALFDDVNAVVPTSDVDKRLVLFPRSSALIDTPVLSAMLAASNSDLLAETELSFAQSLGQIRDTETTKKNEDRRHRSQLLNRLQGAQRVKSAWGDSRHVDDFRRDAKRQLDK